MSDTYADMDRYNSLVSVVSAFPPAFELRDKFPPAIHWMLTQRSLIEAETAIHFLDEPFNTDHRWNLVEQYRAELSEVQPRLYAETEHSYVERYEALRDALVANPPEFDRRAHFPVEVQLAAAKKERATVLTEDKETEPRRRSVASLDNEITVLSMAVNPLPTHWDIFSSSEPGGGSVQRSEPLAERVSQAVAPAVIDMSAAARAAAIATRGTSRVSPTVQQAAPTPDGSAKPHRASVPRAEADHGRE